MKAFFAGALPIYKRELFAFFVTPLAWILIGVFLLVQGMHFSLVVDHFATSFDPSESPIQAFFGDTVIPYIILFLLVPPMTMRLFAEERRNNTIESLMTAPISNVALVLAKYAAAFTVYIAMWLPTLLYIVILRRAGDIDVRAVGASYAGVLLVGAGYLAIGLFMSALTDSQFIALVLTSVVVLGLFIVGLGEFVTPEGTTIHDVCAYFSVWGQMSEFSRGIIDSRRLVYDASIIVMPLCLAVRVVDAWKWR